jgi:hypothetical protein
MGIPGLKSPLPRYFARKSVNSPDFVLTYYTGTRIIRVLSGETNTKEWIYDGHPDLPRPIADAIDCLDQLLLERGEKTT